jgi:hypothetical protein
MKFVKVAIAMVAVVAMLGLAQSSTSAHADRVYQGDDYATVSDDHRFGRVCDEESDGHAVWGIWYLDAGGNYAARDAGNDGVCTDTERFAGDAWKFTVCQEGDRFGEFTYCQTERT